MDMDMAMSAVWTKIDEQSVVLSLRDAIDELDGADGDLTLDFSSVPRVDTTVIRTLEELATRAEDKKIKIVLRGVNVDVYKVLKLMKLGHRFSFIN